MSWLINRNSVVCVCGCVCACVLSYLVRPTHPCSVALLPTSHCVHHQSVNLIGHHLLHLRKDNSEVSLTRQQRGHLMVTSTWLFYSQPAIHLEMKWLLHKYIFFKLLKYDCKLKH